MKYDVICVIDPRFTGGTAAALAADVAAFLEMGLQVGLIEVHSPYLDDMGAARSDAITALRADSRLHLLDDPSGGPILAKTVFLHHPMTFFHGVRERVRLRADRSYLVGHHPPFRGDGSLQYDPVVTTWRAWRATGTRPIWAPVSGICRQQLQSFAPLIRLTQDEWHNVFDVDAWTPQRRKFSSERIAVGRHGRPDLLKWPESVAKINASLPDLPETDIHVLGVPASVLRARGLTKAGWNILPFGTLPVPQFLDQLDIFAYHYHADYCECFGRTVAEAMLMGVVCVLDPRLEPTFGDLAIYSEPAGTAQAIAELRADPAAALARADRARAAIIARHAATSVPGRLFALTAAKGTRGHAKRVASPFEVMRKTAGMMRRGEYFLWQLGARH